MHRALPRLTESAKAVLERYTWPGNTRELQHAMLRAGMLVHTEQLDTNDLPADVVEASLRAAADSANGPGDGAAAASGDNERRVLMIALAAAAGDVERAAEIMSVSAEALRHLMRKHSIDS
jgi:DNA-binding NtrC family response regulator